MRTSSTLLFVVLMHTALASASVHLLQLMSMNVATCRYLNLLRDAFNGSGSGRGLHFSFDVNITQTQQRAAQLATDAGATAKLLHATADPRFFWNQSLLQPLIGAIREGNMLRV